MTAFRRRFDAERAVDHPPQWWDDLLLLWRPSGVPAGTHGLRLAIRNGSVNFYRKGQSIAYVRFPEGCDPYMELHAKYVYPDSHESIVNNRVRITANPPEGSRSVISYEGPAALRRWIDTVETTHITPEKKQIDLELDVSPDVIDLEMGMSKPKQNIDIVCVERAGDGLRLAFWEAKRTKGEGRVRVRDREQKPEVLEQLERYRQYFRVDANVKTVASEYQGVARMLIRLREYADTLGPAYPLGETIVAAAGAASLLVDREPRLVMFLDASDTTWRTLHAPKLHGAGIAIAEITPPTRLDRSLLG